MNLPRWTAYVALAVIAVLFVSGIPKRSKSAPARRSAPAAGPADHPRVIILGIDGLDPDILREVMERHPEGMANFHRLAGMGQGVLELGTSTPPQSPVAWSNFATGRRAGGHGVYDFIHRDPATYGIAPSTIALEEQGGIGLPGTDIVIPTGGGARSSRSGEAFWTLLADAGVPANLYRVPINYPVEPSKGVSVPGMLTPALDSPYGLYTVYSTEPPARLEQDSGTWRPVRVRDGVVRTQLHGPANAFREGAPVQTVPLTFYVDRDAGSVIVELDGERVVMAPGQWSRFMSARFELLPAGAMGLAGMTRFYLKSIDPVFEVYAAPVNFDPRDPADVIATPDGAAEDLAEAIGPYYTKGMAEDVGALKEGALDDAEFMGQAELVYLERRRMLDHALERHAAAEEGGLLFVYVSSVDLSMHMMWRHQDPAHPAHDPALAGTDSSGWSGRDGSTWRDVVDDLYLRMDPLVGRVLDSAPEDALVMVMSDHGFAPYRRKFSLNTWLLEEGYLTLLPGKARELELDDPGHVPVSIASAVDWSKTRAYGVGFNGLYLNLEGREASGIVRPGAEAELLVEELAARLEMIRDGDERVVLAADISADLFGDSPRAADAPEIIVGYNADYGNSDEASLGRIPAHVLTDNTGGTFNGSHLMHPSVVGGVLLTSGRVTSDAPRLEDLTASILSLYGVELPAEMVGQPVLEPND